MRLRVLNLRVMNVRVLIVTFALLLGACAAVPRPNTASSPVGPPPYEAWAKVLQKHVDDQGRINFAALARDRAELDRFVAYVYDTGPNNRPNQFVTAADVLAYHLNAYNALAMHKVIDAGIPESFAGFKKVSFFAFGKVQVGGEPISLYDYENKVIRPLGDPRIHVALNCMAAGCPQLPREPFIAQRLEQQLEREANKFFNEVRNVSVNTVDGVVTLSEILNFFPEDFLAKAPSLIAYVNRYSNAKIPEHFNLVFRPYDWTVNRQPGN